MAKKIALFSILSVLLVFSVSSAITLHNANVSIEGVESSKEVVLQIIEEPEKTELIDSSYALQRVMLTNCGEKAWVRIQRTYERSGSMSSSIQFFEKPSLDCFSSQDGYIYFMRPLDAGESISWKEYITLPEELRDYSNSELCSTLRADGVQSIAFFPDFTQDNPWGFVVPEKAIEKTGGYHEVV